MMTPFIGWVAGNMMKRATIKAMSTGKMALLGMVAGLILATSWGDVLAARQQMTDKEREKLYLRQQFARHFKSIQETSQSLIRAIEKKNLSANQLSREARLINRSAKSLRGMMALGELAKPEPMKIGIESSRDFDQAIRQLAQLIHDFAHNPIHQNSKVFNTRLAARAQTDLLSIISLSKMIEEQSGRYDPASH